MTEFSNIPPLLNPSSVRSLRFDEEDISRQKNCVPGPNVQFGNKLPFPVYISNITKPGTLGCNPDQYPKYTDGKYCCETTMATPQEQLDYVNMLIQSAIDNVGESSFKKYSGNIIWLKDERNYLLKKYKEHNLKDTLGDQFPIIINDVSYTNLDEYILHNLHQSNIYSRDITHKERRQGRDSDIETNINSSINEIRDRPLYPPNMKKSEYYNSIDKKEGGKRRYCKGCRKTIKRRKSRKIRTNKKNKKSKRYTKK
jgi:hypothetical protein